MLLQMNGKPVPSPSGHAHPHSPSLAPLWQPVQVTASDKTSFPTIPISSEPTIEAKVTVSGISQISNFFALGDVPYTKDQAQDLSYQMQHIPASADFVVHVGDIRSGSTLEVCSRTVYSDIAARLSLSASPVFILPGDNDWGDCANADKAWEFWKDEFLDFETRYWTPPFEVVRQPDHKENFSFQLKGSLYIGVDLVGGYNLDSTEWSTRLTDGANWAIDLIRSYQQDNSPDTGAVVLFGHVNPTRSHDDFFMPLSDFIENELENSIPILYLHGDDHKWSYEPNWLGQSSLLKIMVRAYALEPPVKVIVNATIPQDGVSTSDAFQYDRDLANTDVWNSPLS